MLTPVYNEERPPSYHYLCTDISPDCLAELTDDQKTAILKELPLKIYSGINGTFYSNSITICGINIKIYDLELKKIITGTSIPASVEFTNVPNYFIMESNDFLARMHIINNAIKLGYKLIPNSDIRIIEMLKEPNEAVTIY